jgi:hypothetical protein
LTLRLFANRALTEPLVADRHGDALSPSVM